jgi:hypothetical protein
MIVWEVLESQQLPNYDGGLGRRRPHLRAKLAKSGG